MAETKGFPTSIVLSVVTGRLLCDIGGVYEVLGWMTGEQVFTHQIPRIDREATPVILALHPSLSDAVAEAHQVNPDNWREWLATWVARYGESLAVPKMTADEHERIDPMSELAEKIPPRNIIVASTGQ